MFLRCKLTKLNFLILINYKFENCRFSPYFLSIKCLSIKIIKKNLKIKIPKDVL